MLVNSVTYYAQWESVFLQKLFGLGKTNFTDFLFFSVCPNYDPYFFTLQNSHKMFCLNFARGEFSQLTCHIVCDHWDFYATGCLHTAWSDASHDKSTQPVAHSLPQFPVGPLSGSPIPRLVDKSLNRPHALR